jgi:hypothetical protein
VHIFNPLSSLQPPTVTNHKQMTSFLSQLELAPTMLSVNLREERADCMFACLVRREEATVLKKVCVSCYGICNFFQFYSLEMYLLFYESMVCLSNGC